MVHLLVPYGNQICNALETKEMSQWDVLTIRLETTLNDIRQNIVPAVFVKMANKKPADKFMNSPT